MRTRHAETAYKTGGVAGPSNAIRQHRALSMADPTAWNDLPVVLRLTPVAHSALYFSL